MLKKMPAVWDVTAPEFPLAATVVPSVNDWPGSVTTSFVIAPNVCDKEPRLVEVVSPAMAPVNVGVILPEPDTFAPSEAFTVTPLMVKTSNLFVPPTVRGMVIVVLV